MARIVKSWHFPSGSHLKRGNDAGTDLEFPWHQLMTRDKAVLSKSTNKQPACELDATEVPIDFRPRGRGTNAGERFQIILWSPSLGSYSATAGAGFFGANSSAVPGGNAVNRSRNW